VTFKFRRKPSFSAGDEISELSKDQGLPKVPWCALPNANWWSSTPISRPSDGFCLGPELGVKECWNFIVLASVATPIPTTTFSFISGDLIQFQKEINRPNKLGITITYPNIHLHTHPCIEYIYIYLYLQYIHEKCEQKQLWRQEGLEMPSHLVLGWSADLVLTPGGWRKFRDLPGKPMVKP